MPGRKKQSDKVQTPEQESTAPECEEQSIEQMLDELENIVAQMEQDISVEESFALYRKGMEMTKKCEERLGNLEKEIQVISNGED